MNKKSLSTLEFYKIIDELTDMADSVYGKALCKELLPMTDFQDIDYAQRQTQAALSRIYKNGAPSFHQAKGIKGTFLRLEAGGVLGAGELLSISSLLECAGSLKNYNGDTEDILTKLFNLLEPVSALMREINRCIISEEVISDDASIGLKNVRRNIKNVNNKIHDQLGSILNSKRTLLQDALITMRNGRYCLPVKAEYKSSFPGMVHDQSATGSTLFIEPMAIVTLNNELKQLELTEKEEIEKVLASLSTLCQAELDFIKNDENI